MYVSLVLKDMCAWLHIGPKKMLTSCKTSISTRLVPPPPFLCSFMKTEFSVSRTNPTHFGAGAHCRSTKVLTPGASWWVCLALVSCHLLEQQSVMCWLGIWPTWQKVFFRATTTVESCCKAKRALKAGSDICGGYTAHFTWWKGDMEARVSAHNLQSRHYRHSIEPSM